MYHVCITYVIMCDCHNRVACYLTMGTHSETRRIGRFVAGPSQRAHAQTPVAELAVGSGRAGLRATGSAGGSLASTSGSARRVWGRFQFFVSAISPAASNSPGSLDPKRRGAQSSDRSLAPSTQGHTAWAPRCLSPESRSAPGEMPAGPPVTATL